MPDCVDYNLTGDYVNLTAGNAVTNGAVTMVTICKPKSTVLDVNYHWMFNISNMGGAFGIQNAKLITYDGGNEPKSSFSIPAVDEWYLIAVSKATGSVVPRFHLYRYSDTSWQHGVGSGSQNNFPLIAGPQFLTFPYASGEEYEGNVLIAGIWNSELSDGTIEGLISSKAAWRTAAPAEAWRFDSTWTISSFVGFSSQFDGTAHGLLGTSDAPAGWSDTETGLIHLGCAGFASEGVSGNTITMQATQNIAIGEQLIVGVVTDDDYTDQPVASISDGTANSYSRIYSATIGLVQHDIWYCTTVAAVSAGTNIVVTLDVTSSAFRTARIDAYQGLATASILDQSTSQAQTSTTAPDSGLTSTTTQADELIYGLISWDGSETLTPGANLTIRSYNFFGRNVVTIARVVSGTGTYKVNGTLSGSVSNTESTVLTLKAAATGPVTTTEYHLDARNLTPLAWR